MITFRPCSGPYSCSASLRCLRVILRAPGLRSHGYHVRLSFKTKRLQVCPNQRDIMDVITPAEDTATPAEVRAVMAALATPEGQPHFAWLCEGLEPRSEPERR